MPTSEPEDPVRWYRNNIVVLRMAFDGKDNCENLTIAVTARIRKEGFTATGLVKHFNSFLISSLKKFLIRADDGSCADQKPWLYCGRRFCPFQLPLSGNHLTLSGHHFPFPANEQ